MVDAAIVLLAGVIAIETRSGGLTVKLVDAPRLPEAAVITVVPWIAPVARPPVLIVATPEEALHKMELVRFCVLPSV